MIWLIVIGGLLVARHLSAPPIFKCRVCGVTLPDYKNYGFNNGSGWRDGFCKRCMLAAKDGRVNVE